jgi:hypothetical protein
MSIQSVRLLRSACIVTECAFATEYVFTTDYLRCYGACVCDGVRCMTEGLIYYGVSDFLQNASYDAAYLL